VRGTGEQGNGERGNRGTGERGNKDEMVVRREIERDGGADS